MLRVFTFSKVVYGLMSDSLSLANLEEQEYFIPHWGICTAAISSLVVVYQNHYSIKNARNHIQTHRIQILLVRIHS